MQSFNVGFAFEDCNASISLNGASITKQSQSWFTKGTSTLAFPEYKYIGDCELEITYKALVS